MTLTLQEEELQIRRRVGIEKSYANIQAMISHLNSSFVFSRQSAYICARCFRGFSRVSTNKRQLCTKQGVSLACVAHYLTNVCLLSIYGTIYDFRLGMTYTPEDLCCQTRGTGFHLRLEFAVGRLQCLNSTQNTQRLGRHEHPFLSTNLGLLRK